MTQDSLQEVKAECQRLLSRIEALESVRTENTPWISCYYNAHTGAIRRSSMDLTRALARLRKP